MNVTTASCVYAITHRATGRLYVGSSVNVGQRWNQHRSELSLGRHGNPKLQAGWNKHGAEAYTFAVVELVADANDLTAREQVWMDDLRPHYNICRVAGSPLGLKRTPEQNAANAARQMGRKHSAETLALMSAAQVGKTLSAEHRAKQSAAAKGRALTPEHRENLSRAMVGKKQSPAAIAARFAGKAAARARRAAA